jgi:hypothetical protein
VVSSISSVDGVIVISVDLDYMDNAYVLYVGACLCFPFEMCHSTLTY